MVFQPMCYNVAAGIGEGLMKIQFNNHLTPPEHLPFLEAVCWDLPDVKILTPEEMLNRYERGWEYRGVLADVGVEEKNFIAALANIGGSWLIHDVQP